MKRFISSGGYIFRASAGAPSGFRCYWGPGGRLAFVIISVGLAALCLGQFRSRVQPRRVVPLPAARLTGKLSFEEAVGNRRSVRSFIARQLSFEQMGQLAWAGQGITDPATGFRTAPSAGAIYPLELYFVTPGGVFVYNPVPHSMEQVSDEDIRERLANAALEQTAVAQAACDIVVAGSVRKLAGKYGKQAKRFMLMEAGHVAQNIQLQAVCLELGAVPIGAFESREVTRVCRLPKELEPIYIICVGYPSETAKARRARQKTAVLIVAGRNFRDEELFETRSVLDNAGVKTVVASSRLGPIDGMLGGTVTATVLVSDLKVEDYEAVVFVGGLGVREYFNDPAALNLVRAAADKRKVLGAISMAPAVLANAGVLSGLRATGYLSERDILLKAGVKYTGAPIERDGLVITGRDALSARQFATAIADALAGR
ncbi:MAG TPA: DJ-1/PfpI family protein [Sedimentisphaerales bacterium]|nr:DJ-1/PfpI family protein [Sedimentisphaerales bacterium]